MKIVFKMKRLIQILAVIALGVVIFWGVDSISHNRQEATLAQPVSADGASVIPASYLPMQPFRGPDFTTAAEKTVHGVVHIRSEFSRKGNSYDYFFGPFGDFFGYPHGEGDQSYEGFGSGVIISSDGYVVTNNHVVEGAKEIEVTLNDKHTYTAEVIGRDPSTDLALIKIGAKDLPYISFGNSDMVRIGEWVLAVGNPFNLTSTVTAGIVSAKARNINILGASGAIESFIQTDAAVNRGNSGGALVNMTGELIGVNAAIASNTGSYTGYSFAIPANIVKKVVDDILSYGSVQRAYLGVVIREVDSKMAADKGLDVVSGVFIDGLSESGGAREAGLREGDVIRSVNQVPTNTTSELLEIIGQHSPGDVVMVDVRRNGKDMQYQVELRNQSGTTDITKKADSEYYAGLGANFTPITADLQKKLGISKGMQVTEVGDGLLQRGGVQAGFIILQINDTEVDSVSDIQDAMNDIEGGVIRIEGVYPNGMRMSYGFVL
jgi:Do/DeqQ family serine protease